MVKQEVIDGVVIRVRDMGDHDRYLTVLTAEKGRITLLAKGSHSLRGAQTAVSQLYTYGNFEYYRRGDFRILKSGSPIEPFYALSGDIDRLNLAAYLCDLTGELTDEGQEAGEMLRLLLNALHSISRDLCPQEQIKGAFELRAAAIAGYEPDLTRCVRCGKTGADFFYLDVMDGALLCADCLSAGGERTPTGAYADEVREARVLCRMPEAVLEAFRYCLRAPLGRLLSFTLTDPADLDVFSKSAETYLLSHIGHGFDSLRFYSELRTPQSHERKGQDL